MIDKDKILVVANGFVLGFGSLYLGTESIQDRLLKVRDFEPATIDGLLVAKHEVRGITTYVTLNTAVCEQIYDFHIATAVPADEPLGLFMHNDVCEIVAAMSREAAMPDENTKAILSKVVNLSAQHDESYLNTPI